MALFSDIAIKCELPNCRIHSYLPFKCVHCNLNFCELHCAAEEHFCKKAENKNPRKKACEYCGSIILDKREEIEKHVTHECRKKKRSIYICQKNDCKTILNGVNHFRCKFCKMMFCLPHRYPEIHNCYKKEKTKKKSFVEIKKNDPIKPHVSMSPMSNKCNTKEKNVRLKCCRIQ